MSKEILSLGVYSTLSMAVIIGVFSWLDNTGNLTSDAALHQAEQSLNRICSQKGIRASDLELVDATAPEQGKHGWQFTFKAPGSGSILVEVNDNGKTNATANI